MADKSQSLTSSLICSKEAPYPGHMLFRFWCDSDILYFTIIDVFCLQYLCGAGGDTTFPPHANLFFYYLILESLTHSPASNKKYVSPGLEIVY